MKILSANASHMPMNLFARPPCKFTSGSRRMSGASRKLAKGFPKTPQSRISQLAQKGLALSRLAMIVSERVLILKKTELFGKASLDKLSVSGRGFDRRGPCRIRSPFFMIRDGLGISSSWPGVKSAPLRGGQIPLLGRRRLLGDSGSSSTTRFPVRRPRRKARRWSLVLMGIWRGSS